MWKLLKYEFRRARTSLLTVLGVIAVLEMYFLISLGVDHMEARRHCGGADDVCNIRRGGVRFRPRRGKLCE